MSAALPCAGIPGRVFSEPRVPGNIMDNAQHWLENCVYAFLHPGQTADSEHCRGVPRAAQSTLVGGGCLFAGHSDTNTNTETILIAALFGQ